MGAIPTGATPLSSNGRAAVLHTADGSSILSRGTLFSTTMGDRLIKAIIAGIAAVGVILGISSPASATATYTSQSFTVHCDSIDPNGVYTQLNSVTISGAYHTANDGSSVTLANAKINNGGGLSDSRSWQVTSSRWEDPSTSGIVKGMTGLLNVSTSIGPWNPNTWYSLRHAQSPVWRVSGYAVSRPGLTLSCSSLAAP